MGRDLRPQDRTGRRGCSGRGECPGILGPEEGPLGLVLPESHGPDFCGPHSPCHVLLRGWCCDLGGAGLERPLLSTLPGVTDSSGRAARLGSSSTKEPQGREPSPWAHVSPRCANPSEAPGARSTSDRPPLPAGLAPCPGTPNPRPISGRWSCPYPLPGLPLPTARCHAMAGDRLPRKVMDAKRLASLLRGGPGGPLVIDSRSFVEYNSWHVLSSVNICCSKLVKRRLQQDKVTIAELIQPAARSQVLGLPAAPGLQEPGPGCLPFSCP